MFRAVLVLVLVLAFVLTCSTGNIKFVDKEYADAAKPMVEGILELDSVKACNSLLVSPDTEFNHCHAKVNGDGSPVMVNGTQKVECSLFKGSATICGVLGFIFSTGLDQCALTKQELHAGKIGNRVQGFKEFGPREENAFIVWGGGGTALASIRKQEFDDMEIESNNYLFYFKRNALGVLKIFKIHAVDSSHSIPAAERAIIYSKPTSNKRCKAVKKYYDTIKTTVFFNQDKLTGY